MTREMAIVTNSVRAVDSSVGLPTTQARIKKIMQVQSRASPNAVCAGPSDVKTRIEAKTVKMAATAQCSNERVVPLLVVQK